MALLPHSAPPPEPLSPICWCLPSAERLPKPAGHVGHTLRHTWDVGMWGVEWLLNTFDQFFSQFGPELDMFGGCTPNKLSSLFVFAHSLILTTRFHVGSAAVCFTGCSSWQARHKLHPTKAELGGPCLEARHTCRPATAHKPPGPVAKCSCKTPGVGENRLCPHFCCLKYPLVSLVGWQFHPESSQLFVLFIIFQAPPRHAGTAAAESSARHPPLDPRPREKS